MATHRQFSRIRLEKRARMALFDLIGVRVLEKQSHFCRRKPNRAWEADHQECGDPLRERSRDRDLENLVPEGWPNVEGDRVTATAITDATTRNVN